MISPILIIFFSITALFILLLIVKAITKQKFCVLCASVSLTWVTLLILYWLNRFNEPLLIAVLMGGSVVGIYYLVEKKTKEKLHIFRLPFFLTLVFVVYLLIGFTDQIFLSVIFFILLWLIFILIYFYRNHSTIRRLADRIIACCKDW